MEGYSNPVVSGQPGEKNAHGPQDVQLHVVGQQPQGVGFAPQAGMVQVPPGLDYLAHLDRVKVSQVLHVVEMLTGWERNNIYNIMNVNDQQFLTAKEDTDCCQRQWLGNLRPFQINFTNMQGQVVMALNRDCRCQGSCCPCCLQEMYIEFPPGQRMATIKEKWSCMTPRYEIFDAGDNLIYTIEGECCYCKCCTDVPFKVFRADGQSGGDIIKHWAGARECFGGANNFSVVFSSPQENIINKVILLGATFLVDYMYFEQNQK